MTFWNPHFAKRADGGRNYTCLHRRFPVENKGSCQEEVVQEESRKASRDGLDDYIKVSSPGLLVIIGALSLVLVATIVWGFTGTIPVTLTVTGCVVDTEALSEQQVQNGDAAGDAYAIPDGVWIARLVDSSKYSAEQIVKFGGDVTIAMPDRTTFKEKIEYVTPYPLNRDEVRQYLRNSDWVVDQCVNSNYSWGIAVHVYDDISDHMFTTPQVTMITDEVPPISFLAR